MINRTKWTQYFSFIDHTFLKPCICLAFFYSTTLLVVRLSAMLTVFPLSFFLDLKILLQTLYLVNLTIMGRGILLSSFRFPKRCVLSISWMVIYSHKSFFTMLIISWSVSSLLFSSTPCTRRQFLLENCSWQSSVLLTWKNFSFKDVKSSFNSAIYFSFFFQSASYSSNFSFLNFMDSLTSSSCLASLIWASLVEEESS